MVVEELGGNVGVSWTLDAVAAATEALLRFGGILTKSSFDLSRVDGLIL